MADTYHVDGELVDRADATVHVDDRGFRYGDAAFETCRAYGGTVFLWARHRDRLEATCETLGMPEAVPDDLDARIDETLAANDLEDAYVRVSVTRGVQPGTLSPLETVDPTVVVYVKPLPPGGTNGEAIWDGPAIVQSVDTRRIPDSALPVEAKTHNYLNGILARLELRESDVDADEAIVCDTEGYVAEGTTSNVCFVDGETLYTPETGTILPGITRSVILDAADEMDFSVETGRYELERLLEADEAFLTNTTWELRPIGHLDGTAIGGGPVTERLRQAYDDRVENRCYGESTPDDDQNL